MIYLVIILPGVGAALLLTRFGVSPIVAAMLALPLAVCIWFAGCFICGGIMGVIAAFRYSFRKDRI